MKTIESLFGLPAANVPADAFGVELELEHNNRHVEPTHFHVERDGSLRVAGLEYVMKKPMGLRDAKDALFKLRQEFIEAGNTPKATNLASSHIHINCRGMSWEQTLEFIALIMTFEVCIAKNSGEDRWQNYFAVGSCESDILVRRLAKCRDEMDFKRTVQNLRIKDQRYSGINLISLTTYGTVEVRYLGAQPDPRTVAPWLDFYDTLRSYAKVGVEWHNLFEAASMGDLAYLQEELKAPFEINPDDLLMGIRNAQDVVFPISHDHVSAPSKGNGLAKFYRKFN